MKNLERLPCAMLDAVKLSANLTALRRISHQLSSEAQQKQGTIDEVLDRLKPDVVLSEANRKNCAEILKHYRFPTKVLQEVNKAAVLVPLCMHKGELGLLYTLRSSKLNTNRGQVSFPGGIQDEADKSLEETALRETWEELNISKDTVDIWVSGNPIVRTNVSVLPVLGYVGEVDPDTLKINPDEVEEAFFISLRNICDPANFRYTQFRNNYIVPTYLGGKHRIWGLTAGITHIVMKALVPEMYKHELTYLQPIGKL
ncbi:nucleoside diphosphate-linked moiety X motif 8 [Orussus abietinus]|uniref:nucleoside diphosphate-linked moiety X motif 8 n=1 Tax=Orussus abietinus TaxID=222816 RepID=UPI00062589A0|nr:nucleoside diphosphate-linked moiety X motif 8 [Orussus abietinus]